MAFGGCVCMELFNSTQFLAGRVEHLNSTQFFGGKSLTFKFDALFSLTIVATYYSERIVRPLSSRQEVLPTNQHDGASAHKSTSTIAAAAIVFIIAVGTKQSRRRRRHHRRRLWDRE